MRARNRSAVPLRDQHVSQPRSLAMMRAEFACFATFRHRPGWNSPYMGSGHRPICVWTTCRLNDSPVCYFQGNHADTGTVTTCANLTRQQGSSRHAFSPEHIWLLRTDIFSDKTQQTAPICSFNFGMAGWHGMHKPPLIHGYISRRTDRVYRNGTSPPPPCSRSTMKICSFHHILAETLNTWRSTTSVGMVPRCHGYPAAVAVGAEA